MKSQRKRRPRRVLKGRAVLDAWAQTKRLRMKVVVKRRPGKRRAVCRLVSMRLQGIVEVANHHCVSPPVHASECFVHPCGKVSGENTRENEKTHADTDEATSETWVQNADTAEK